MPVRLDWSSCVAEGVPPMPQVVVPPPYRGPTLGAERIDAPGATVGECLEAVGKRFAGFAELIFDGSGRVHKFVKLFVNGDEIARSALDQPVADADEIEILAAIAGG
ncbi:MAG: MoaD/ThiS family protein [Deltaproteobacteria bacterium]|nr:MAG: MoaD/ThiS family protein [Deltaproteobacteria bacterium]